MAKSKYNWDEIENEYVTGNLSYRELAEKYNKVSEHRIQKVGRTRKWVKKRREYRDSLNAEVRDEKKKNTVLEKSRFDELTTRVCDTVAASMAKLSTKEYDGKTLTPARASEILAASQKAQDVKYRALGIPPPKTQSQVDEEAAYLHYQSELAKAEVQIEEDILTGKIKVIKRAKGNGRPELNSNDFIEIEIEEPASGTSKN